MTKIFIQNRSAADVAKEYVTMRNNFKHGSDAAFIKATADVPAGASNTQRMAALYEKYAELTKAGKTGQAEAYADAIVFYNVQRHVADFKKRNPDAYEYEAGDTRYDSTRDVAVSYAKQLYYKQERDEKAAAAKTEREAAKKAEVERKAALSPQEQAIEAVAGVRRNGTAVTYDKQVTAALDRYLNKLPADMPADERFNRARHSINQRLEKIDGWFVDGGETGEVNALKRALRVIDKQEALENAPAKAPKASEGPSSVAAESKPKADHAKLATDYVLKGQSSEVRNEVLRIMRAAEGRTTPEKMAYLSAALKEAGEEGDPALKTNILRAIGVLNLKNRMDETGTTKWRNTNTEAYFDRALANADALRTKQEAGVDIATRDPEKSSGGRARVYSYKGKTAPSDAEVPVMGENQVTKLQELLVAAGENVGPTGADGKYGPNTHEALKRFAAKMTPPITDLSTIDCTDKNCPQYKQLMAALGEKGPSAGESKDEPKAEPKVATQTVLQARFAKEIASTASVSSAAINYYTDKEAAEKGIGALVQMDKKFGTSAADTMIKSSVVEAFEEQNLPLSKQQIANLTVTNGIVYSPELKAVETALGLVADGQLDERLRAILKIPEVKEVVAAAFKDGKLSELAEAAPQSLPGGKGNGAAKG